jgi:hypothetical protein
METLDPVTEEFLSHISARRYAEAKELALNTSLWSGSERLAGRRAGCLGLVARFTKKTDDLLDSVKLDKLKQTLLRLQSSLDCDEFERGYIDVWLKYIDSSSNKDGVKEDPSEEE